MKIRKRVLVLALIALATVSWADNVPIEIKNAFQLYRELIYNHLFDKEWRKINIKDIYHSEAPFRAGLKKYCDIDPNMEIDNGMYLFTDYQMEQLKLSIVEFLNDKNEKENEKIYLVEIIYTCLGIKINDKYKFYEKPKYVPQYLVFRFDITGEKYKIFDAYPAKEYTEFVSAKYLTINARENNVSEEVKKKIEDSISGK
jgi:hypothetical protein